MNANSFYISDTSYERILQTAEHDLAALARGTAATLCIGSRAVEEEIRFTKHRIAVSPDNRSAAVVGK